MDEKPGIIFIHFNEIEAMQLLERYFPAKAEVQVHFSTHETLKPQTKNLSAVVISLERLPSHGKQCAMYYRSSAARRKIPLIFAGGKSEKVDAYRELFSDAFFCNFEGLCELLSDVNRNYSLH
ncbi:MAG: hypothetical protein KDC13_04085 [Bacteroidetes bacterium]|nr:hypothetical protein [Bacteroidota bacterium]